MLNHPYYYCFLICVFIGLYNGITSLKKVNNKKSDDNECGSSYFFFWINNG